MLMKPILANRLTKSIPGHRSSVRHWRDTLKTSLPAGERFEPA